MIGKIIQIQYCNFVSNRLKVLLLSILIVPNLFWSTITCATWQEKAHAISNTMTTEIIRNLALSEEEQNRLAAWLTQLNSGERKECRQSINNLVFYLISLKQHFSAKPGIDRQELYTRANTLQDDLILLNAEIEQEPTTNLQQETTKYFTHLLGDKIKNIEFSNQSGGTQLGKIAKITLTDLSAPISYYIKTHRGGTLASNATSNSYSTKEVDPKELLIYKIFALLKLAPEVHFFFGEEGAKSFYIATQDAAFAAETGEQKTFITYNQLPDAPQTGASYHKILELYTQWSKDPEKTSKAATTLEDQLSRSEYNIIKGLTKADILARTFLLGDFTINSGNIGFVLHDTLAEATFKVLDFALPKADTEYMEPRIFTGFLSGNRPHCYKASVDNVMRYALHTREQSKRIETAKEVMAELIEAGILNDELSKEAQTCVLKPIAQCPNINLQEATDDLDKYIAGIKFNIHRFKEHLGLLYSDDYIYHLLTHYLPGLPSAPTKKY